MKTVPRGSEGRIPAGSGRHAISDQAFSMPFYPGEIVDEKYEVVELVGVGGVGFVVSAKHIELGEKVVLKLLRPEMLGNPEVGARFAREAHACAKIKSEHVARVFDVGTLPEGAPFIVMEYLDGMDLERILANQGRLPIRTAVEYIMQACEALAAAHAAGIVHRDIKPENLFLTQLTRGIDVIKVLDFGISKVALTGSPFQMNAPLVQTTLAVGSPVYMSPEQIRASCEVDARTDIWSVGCVLYELLTGQLAFNAPAIPQLMSMILEQDPGRPSSIVPEIPNELDVIVARCLEKDRARRYQNIAELALALFPFAPRRARLSAERCCLVLGVADAAQAEFELPSVRPRRWSGSPSATFPIGSAREMADPSLHPTVSSGTNAPTQSASTRRWNWALLLVGAVLLAVVLLIWYVTRVPGAGRQSLMLSAAVSSDIREPGRCKPLPPNSRGTSSPHDPRPGFAVPERSTTQPRRALGVPAPTFT